METPPDDGTADWAAEQAVVFAAQAWYRRTHYEKSNGGGLILTVVEVIRANITPEQWREIGGS